MGNRQKTPHNRQRGTRNMFFKYQNKNFVLEFEASSERFRKRFESVESEDRKETVVIHLLEENVWQPAFTTSSSWESSFLHCCSRQAVEISRKGEIVYVLTYPIVSHPNCFSSLSSGNSQNPKYVYLRVVEANPLIINLTKPQLISNRLSETYNKSSASAWNPWRSVSRSPKLA